MSPLTLLGLNTDPSRICETVRELVFAMPADDVTVRISRKLYEEIDKRVRESQGEFRDVREYVEFVLGEVVKEDEETGAPYTPEEEEEIKRRLKALGYI